MIKKGYKVVKAYHDHYSPVCSGMKIKYRVCEWVTRQLFSIANGPYTYFELLDDAIRFYNKILISNVDDTFQIWCINADPYIGKETPNMLYYRDWVGWNWVYDGCSLENLPVGTRFTNRFMLLHKVDPVIKTR